MVPQEEKAATLFRFSDMASPFMVAACATAFHGHPFAPCNHNRECISFEKEGTKLSAGYQKVSSCTVRQQLR